MSSVTLTVKDLIEICEFMGVAVPDIDRYSYDHLEDQLTIHQSHKGIAVFDQETGKEERYQLVVTCDGCDSNEVQPIEGPL